MEKNKVLVYGAAGYMGQLFLKQARHANFDLVLGSRSKIDTNYPLRLFSLENHASIVENIKDVKLVINLAGPFKNTNKPLVEACIAKGTHYIDIAGEVAELETVFTYNEKAKEANVMLMPGAGFGVVPTDIAANMTKEKLPDATYLKIAYVTDGGASRGTLKTLLGDINKAGVILENGVYKKAMPASKSIELRTNNKEYRLVYNPWRADLFTAKISTGILNIETYANFPNLIEKMMRGKLLWLRDFLLKRLINSLPTGPSEKQIKKGSTICYAEAGNSSGEKAKATVLGPEAYLFTAETLVRITQKIIDNHTSPGFQTPNIYGVELITSIPKVEIL